jgi:Zn-finger nucleic acid-binding protein
MPRFTPLCAQSSSELERFGIEIEQCARCGGRLRVLASIEEPELIEWILVHRRERGEEAASTASLGARAPPQAPLF